MPARNSPISDGFIFRRTHAGMGMSIAQPDTFRSTKVPPRASTRSISCHARAVAGCRAKPSAMDDVFSQLATQARGSAAIGCDQFTGSASATH